MLRVAIFCLLAAFAGKLLTIIDIMVIHRSLHYYIHKYMCKYAMMIICKMVNHHAQYDSLFMITVTFLVPCL